MHTDSTIVERPLLRRTLVQAVAVMSISILVLSSVSFFVARRFLVERATLHANALVQSTVELLGQELAEHRVRAKEIAASKELQKTADIRMLDQKQRETTVVVLVSPDGVTGIAVDVPHGTQTMRIVFPADVLIGRLQSAAKSSGETAAILFGHTVTDGFQVIRIASPEGAAAVTLADVDSGLALANAVNGTDSMGFGEDYRGRDVIAASRSLPTLGWGVTAQIDADEVLEGVRILELFHLLLGIGLLLIAIAAALWLAHGWTASVRSLAERVRTLGPGNWAITSELKTRDEAALLERVIVDMAARLQGLYEHLEELVQERTTELRRQYELDRAVLRTMEHGVIAVDDDGHITALNPAAERIVGKKLADVFGTDVRDVLPLADSSGPMLGDAHPVIRVLSKQESVRPQPGTAWTTGSDDVKKSLYLIATPLTLAERVFGAVAVFQDITKEREVEQLKSEFITLASHQLRTPLSIIQWQMDTLRDAAATADTRSQALTEVERATLRMTSITNALLQVAELEGGALTPKNASINLQSLMHGAMLGVIDGNKKHMRVEENVPDNLVLKSDPVFLEMVLQNLIENAIKYSPERGLVMVSAQEKGGDIEITVKDEGAGIPEEEQRHVFEKFFRGENVKKTSTDGTGLGLYIVKMIIAQLGGSIRFESTEGRGTTFTVTLPRT